MCRRRVTWRLFWIQTVCICHGIIILPTAQKGEDVRTFIACLFRVREVISSIIGANSTDYIGVRVMGDPTATAMTTTPTLTTPTAELHSEQSTEKIVQLVIQATNFKILMQAIKLKLFDYASRDEGISTKFLRTKCGYHENVCERLLDSLVCLGFLHRGTKEGQHIYRNSQSARKHLTSDSNTSLTDWLILKDLTNETIEYDNMTSVLTSGLTNSYFNDMEAPKTTQCHSPTANGLQNQQAYIRGIKGYFIQASGAIIQAIDFSKYKMAIDVGGNSGYFGQCLIQKYQDLHVKVFDLPRVISMVTELDDYVSHDRLTFVPGDFFKDEIPSGDLIIFSHVLFNWADEQVATLLSSAYRSLHKGGSILILEKCLEPENTGPEYLVGINVIFSLVKQPGRARTVEDYTRLLQAQGFTGVSYRPIHGVNLYDIIEAKKPTED